jgi:hypothetical protein
MDKIKPNQYINLRRKLCKPQIVITAHRLAAEWGLTPEEACYRFLCEGLAKEYNKRIDK